MDSLADDKLVSIGNRMIVPLASRPGQTSTIDLDDIALAEARLQDIECLTHHKAPELTAHFLDAWRKLDRLVKHLKYQKAVAEMTLKRERSRALLDDVPGQIKARGLTNTKDVRDALVTQDVKVQAAEELVNQLDCILALVEGKQDAMQKGYMAARTFLADPQAKSMGYVPNPDLNGDSGSAEVGEVNPPRHKPFFTPSY